MSPAAEALLRKEESLQMGQAERFGALGGAQSQTEAFSKESQSPGGRSLCSGCGPESCWVLQEGCLVASHPVLQKLPRLVSPPSPTAALLSSLRMSGSLYMKGKRPACAFNPPDERNTAA